MASRRICAALAAAVALGSTGVMAQASAPAGSSVAPLTVEGKAPPKTIQKQAFTFTQVYTAPTPRLGLIGRWREPICVQVVNLTPDQAAMVKARIEEVATGVGLPAARAGCTPNIQIVLTNQPQAFIDKAAKANDSLLGFHYPSDTNKAKAVTHPIQGWYKTATQSAHFGHDGLPFAPLGNRMPMEAEHQGVPANDPQASSTNLGSIVGETHAAETVDSPNNGSPPGCAGSLINHCERTVFKNVLVVVDGRAVGGKDLGALADYLAMMSLSQAKQLDGCTALPSIFDLMAKTPCPGREPPTEITAADAALLTALYAANPETAAASMQVDIAGRMAELLIKNDTQRVVVRRDDKEPSGAK